MWIPNANQKEIIYHKIKGKLTPEQYQNFLIGDTIRLEMERDYELQEAEIEMMKNNMMHSILR